MCQRVKIEAKQHMHFYIFTKHSRYKHIKYKKKDKYYKHLLIYFLVEFSGNKEEIGNGGPRSSLFLGICMYCSSERTDTAWGEMMKGNMVTV
jgi:hypothetical protein